MRKKLRVEMMNFDEMENSSVVTQISMVDCELYLR